MLTTRQKAEILKRAGIAVPPFPAAPAPGNEHRILEDAHAFPVSDTDPSVDRWTATIESFYVDYIAARAAKSLRESVEAEGLRHLQAANLSRRFPPRPRHEPDTD